MSSDRTSPPTITQIEALAQRGLFDAADAACREVLACQPQAHKAWTLLGMLAVARRRPAEAEPALRRAIELHASDARYWNTLCLALQMLGRPAEAEDAARQALALSDTAEHWAALGNCFYNQQRWNDAALAYREAVSRKPGDSDVWTQLGAAEHMLGRLDAAQTAFERSLSLVADDPNATMRYAVLLMQRGQIQRAIDLLQQLLTKSPQMQPAWLALGNAERLRDNLPRAEAAYRQAVSLAPRDREGRYNLALILLQQSRYCEAEPWIQQLVAENPNDGESLIVLAGTLLAQGRADEAIPVMSRSVELKPDPPSHSKLLVALHHDEGTSPQVLLEAHRKWDNAYARSLAPISPPPRSAAVPRSLRIGFSGIDFSSSPTGYLGLRGIECLDKAQCSVAIYADRVGHDSYTNRFQAVADIWRPTIGLTDEELARQVREDEIDVWVDLGGHVGRRLLAFARRPAPLQVTWLGYVGTTGLAAMDGLIADPYHVHPGEGCWYTEKVLRMPHDYICYGPPDEVPEVGPLPALKSGIFTFGCFNNPAKYSPSMLDAWAMILRRVPSSQLFLKYGGLDHTEFQNRIRGQMTARGVAPERIVFEGGSRNLELMARYGEVDLALDTRPYSGGLTTCEALWMGVPVVTCPGQTFASRHSTSHLTNAGYGEFIANDLESYIELAIHWSSHLDELSAIRTQMRERVRQSPLCDAPRFGQDLLALLQHAWSADT